MASRINGQPQKSLKESLQGIGIDHDMLLRVGLRLKPDPLSGEIELDDFAQYLYSHMDDPDVQNMISTLSSAHSRLEEDRKDAIKTIDYSSLPVVRHTVWLVQILFTGLETPDGKDAATSSSAASSRQDRRQMFTLSCTVKLGPGANIDTPRVMTEFVGLPNSNQVEDFIRGAIGKPYPPLEPCLPNLLMLSSKLKHHEAALRPFLDSLPEPFEWRVVPQHLEEDAREFQYVKSQHDLERYLELALEKKEEGNIAFGAKDGVKAIEAYEEAIRLIHKAVSIADDADDKMTSRIISLGAVCHANCSAARLLPGGAKDVHKALSDAKRAVQLDEHYAKGYVRLSRAYEALSEGSQAEESIATALRKPQLENHEGLVNRLIMLQTDGKGLPKNYEAYVDWNKKIFIEGETAERMKTVGGLWRKLCEKHGRKFERAAKLSK